MNFPHPLVTLKEEFDYFKTLKQILKLVHICCFHIDSFGHWEEVIFGLQITYKIIHHLSILPKPEMIREDNGEGIDENENGN